MMIMMMNDDSDETHSTPEFSYHYRKTVRLRQTPCTIVFDQFLIVCVSLFYVIDTGSTGSRARHHVTGWGLPICTFRVDESSMSSRVRKVRTREPVEPVSITYEPSVPVVFRWILLFSRI